MNTGVCSQCYQEYPIDQIWAFNRSIDQMPDLWCQRCLIPKLQGQAQVFESLTARYTHVLAAIGRGLRQNPNLDADGVRCLKLIEGTTAANPPESHVLVKLLTVLTAIENYGYTLQAKILEEEFGWYSENGRDGLAKNIARIITTLEDVDVQGGVIRRPNAQEALRWELRRVLEDIMGFELWSATCQADRGDLIS